MVSSGVVIVTGVTFTTATDAPTIRVIGGGLALRNDTIQESTGSTDAAIALTGGSLDLGTAADAGNNVLNINGTGEFVHNTTPNQVPAAGDTFEVNGTPLTASSLSFTALSSSGSPSILNQAVTFTATVRPDGFGTPTGSVDFLDTTTNTDLGSAPLSGGTATLTSSALSVGTHVIRATYSGDSSFTLSIDSVAQNVHYNFIGFLPPLDKNPAFAVGRTIPIKFQLTDYNGVNITSLSAITSLQVAPIISDRSLGTPLTPAGPGNTGLAVHGSTYAFNWQTKGLAAGSYAILLSLADCTVQSQVIQLTNSGSSADLTTVAAGGTGGGSGGLLGGDITHYVDNSNGDLTTDEPARARDAAMG
jgi:hypothetical protein